ncbi:hypothetical protein Acsp04_65720 [Actinomadura sp. NBRC 104425]|uniref:RICIN domain-containing protein n=1 Tax=Actinomadura sp. NBRC 104425 TaxID=3032204 RepID=UPI0024A22A72|nr:RICIN domain-containing protein [Actinomadura sp. NBRC 104425]GLZ16337.1 hypothetical protein Acsp04_65720 [Actinomadura sp. NBRC 104425]
MSEQTESERKRRQRVSLANAFDRRAWQRGEQPKVHTRILAGGVALIVAATAVFAVGALISYQKGKNEERKNNTTLSRPVPSPTVTVSPTASKSPTASPSRSRTRSPQQKPATTPRTTGSAAKAKAAKPAATSRFPTGPKFSTTTNVLIRNVMTGLCADVPGYGNGKLDGPVEQYNCDGTKNDNQLWDLVVNQKGAGPNGVDLFTIRNSKDGLCMDLPDYGRPVKTAQVTEWHCNPGSGDNQMWYLDKKKDGQFWIRNHSSGGLCLDVAGVKGSGGPAAKLTLYPCTIEGDHLWSFS